MSETYTLYGSHASYLTACSRSYLCKKGIPFVERLPAVADAPRVRECDLPTLHGILEPRALPPRNKGRHRSATRWRGATGVAQRTAFLSHL